ncbi:MAG: SDR family NAD(P)-dependent oxidoreductase, partial [Thermodesulfobacteriota bacterium]
MRASKDLKEPHIRKDDLLLLQDPDFIPAHVCIVTGAAGGIGRATAVAAAANGLMTVGLDIDPKEGNKTQQKARELGGQMIFLQT